MIDLILLILLVFGIFVGLKRGFILQLLHLVGFIIAFIVAMRYYDVISPHLELWVPYPDLPEDASWAVFLGETSMESAFYNAIAFFIIFFAVRILLQIIASMLDFVAELPILRSLNKLLGGVFGFIEVYLILFLLLYIGALVPVEVVQSIIEQSGIATFIIEKTPYLSEEIRTLWFEHVVAMLP